MSNIVPALEELAFKAVEKKEEIPEIVTYAAKKKATERAALNNPKFMSNSQIIEILKKEFWNEEKEAYYKEHYKEKGNAMYVMRFLMLLTNTVKRDLEDFEYKGRFASTVELNTNNNWPNIIGTFLVNDLPDEMMINLYYNSQDNNLVMPRNSGYSETEMRNILQTELWNYEEFEKTGIYKFLLEFLICLSNKASRNYTGKRLNPDVEMIPSSYDIMTKLKIPWTTIIHDTLDDLAGTSETKAPQGDEDIRLWGDEFGGELPELPKASPGRRLLINLYNNTNTFFNAKQGDPNFFVGGVVAQRSGKPRSKSRRKSRRKRKRRKVTRRTR